MLFSKIIQYDEYTRDHIDYLLILEACKMRKIDKGQLFPQLSTMISSKLSNVLSQHNEELIAM